MSVKPVPDGYHTVTPLLLLKEVKKEITFLKAAFDAVQLSLHESPEGNVMHAEVQIGDSRIMLGEARAEWQPTPSMLYLYVEDVDRFYQQAVKAGGKSLREPTNEFYGDRSSGVIDAEGNQWWIATHIEDVSAEEMQKRQQAMAKS